MKSSLLMKSNVVNSFDLIVNLCAHPVKKESAPKQSPFFSVFSDNSPSYELGFAITISTHPFSMKKIELFSIEPSYIIIYSGSILYS